MPGGAVGDEGVPRVAVRTRARLRASYSVPCTTYPTANSYPIPRTLQRVPRADSKARLLRPADTTPGRRALPKAPGGVTGHQGAKGTSTDGSVAVTPSPSKTSRLVCSDTLAGATKPAVAQVPQNSFSMGIAKNALTAALAPAPPAPGRPYATSCSKTLPSAQHLP